MTPLLLMGVEKINSFICEALRYNNNNKCYRKVHKEINNSAFLNWSLHQQQMRHFEAQLHHNLLFHSLTKCQPSSHPPFPVSQEGAAGERRCSTSARFKQAEFSSAQGNSTVGNSGQFKFTVHCVSREIWQTKQSVPWEY